MYLLIAFVFVTNYHSWEMDIEWIKLKFNYYVLVLSKILVENKQLYTARLQPDNRDIRITDGRITEVQLYCRTLSWEILVN